MWLCKHLNSSLLTMENLTAKGFSFLAVDARRHYQKTKVGLAGAAWGRQFSGRPTAHLPCSGHFPSCWIT